MLPLRLEIKNFLAYRSPDPIRFDGIHLACLTGPNGAGKSSLLDAITWALWGKARARRDEELVHMGQNDMYVMLEFEQHGLIYQVHRQRTRTKSGAGTLRLFAYDEDGTPNDISEPSMRATQEKISRLINLDYDTFVNSAFLQQGKADAFTTKAPRERKQILFDILGLERWEQYEDAVKAVIKEIDAEISMRSLQVEELDAEIAREPALQADLAEAETQQQEAAAALELAEAALKQVEHAPNELRAALRTKAEIEQRLRSFDGDLQAAADDITRQEKNVARYQRTIAARDEIEAGYAALQDARAADHALGDKLMQLSDLDAQRHALERQLDDARAELRREVGEHEATIRGLERTVNAAQPEALEELRIELAALTKLDDQRADLDAQANALKNERTGLDATNKALLPEMNELRDRIDRLSAAQGATCPLCGQPLTEDHRLSLLAELQEQGTTRGDTYRANQARMKAITGESKTVQDAITDVKVKLQRLPDLQKKEGELKSGVDNARAAELQLHEVRAQRDAAQQTLDGEAFATDVRAQIAALDGQRAALGYDSDQHSAARQGLTTFHEFEGRQKDLADRARSPARRRTRARRRAGAARPADRRAS